MSTSTSYTINYSNDFSLLCDSCVHKCVCKYWNNAAKLYNEIEKLREKSKFPYNVGQQCEFYRTEFQNWYAYNGFSYNVPTLNKGCDCSGECFEEK